MRLGHGIGRGNAGGQRGQPSPSAKRMDDAMKQMLTQHRTNTRGGRENIGIRLGAREDGQVCPFQRHTEAVYKRDENRQRGVHRNFRLCWEGVDNSWKPRNRDLNATINTLRVLIMGLRGTQRLAHCSRLRKRKSGKACSDKIAKAGIVVDIGRRAKFGCLCAF
jgi:hypothetical protein